MVQTKDTVYPIEKSDNVGCIVIIVYKNILADGKKKIVIDLSDDKKDIIEILDKMNIDSFMLSFTDIYNNDWYIPVDNIGEIQVY